MNYTRREDLEGVGLGLCVIDLNGTDKYRIVNCYRLFNPPNNMSQSEHFALQIEKIDYLLSNLEGRKIIIAGDFNLDECKRFDSDYRYKDLFEMQIVLNDKFDLTQVIDFPTWKRVVNNVIKTSTLDHIYVKDPTLIKNLYHVEPLTGDHYVVIFEILNNPEPTKISIKRSWQSYSKQSLLTELAGVDFNILTDDVQSTWNNFESVLLPVIDKIAPLVQFSNNLTVKSLKPSSVIKTKLNLRKRLLKPLKNNPSNVLRDKIKNLNFEIRQHFKSLKTRAVRRKIVPGNCKSLWEAVNIAKNTNPQQLPAQMFLNNNPVNETNLPDEFASFFKNKVQTIVHEQTINENVCNGTQKMITGNLNFMKENDVLIAMKSLKIKKL